VSRLNQRISGRARNRVLVPFDFGTRSDAAITRIRVLFDIQFLPLLSVTDFHLIIHIIFLRRFTTFSTRNPLTLPLSTLNLPFSRNTDADSLLFLPARDDFCSRPILVYFLICESASSACKARCGLLLSMSRVAWSVCLAHEVLCKNG